MALKDDNHGIVFSDSNIKLYYPSHSWNMKALFSNDADVAVMTNGFGDMTKLADQIRNKKNGNIRIICNSNSISEAKQFRKQKNVLIRHAPAIKAVIFLRSDGRIFLGSDDFGKSSDISVSIGVMSKKAYEGYIRNIFNPIWEKSIDV